MYWGWLIMVYHCELKLKERIELMREELYKLLELDLLDFEQTLKTSMELDKLIQQCYLKKVSHGI